MSHTNTQFHFAASLHVVSTNDLPSCFTMCLALHLVGSPHFLYFIRLNLYYVTCLDLLNLEGRWQGLLQLLGLGRVVDNQGVLVSGTSDLELGLLELLTVGVDLGVGLDDSRLDVSSSGQFDELLDVLDLLLELVEKGSRAFQLKVGHDLDSSFGIDILKVARNLR